MSGLILSLIAGLAMSIQGVFNTRLSDRIGTWETSVIVQGSGFILTLIILLFAGNGDFKNLFKVNKLYLSGGIFSVLIIFSVMEGIRKLGTTYAIGAILIAQLSSAGIIDYFGLFNTPKIAFGFNKILGIIIMTAGIIIFKYKH